MIPQELTTAELLICTSLNRVLSLIGGYKEEEEEEGGDYPGKLPSSPQGKPDNWHGRLPFSSQD